MDIEKWATVLVEWANCLKLWKTISCLKDVKRGNFLSKLYNILTQAKPEKDRYLKDIIIFLKDKYSNSDFDYLVDLHFSDLLEIDLVFILSLMLHYSCIHDRRDVLTSPLCHRLSQTTQTYIRAFLENVSNDVNKEALFQVIAKSVCEDTPLQSLRCYELQAGDSFGMCRSPLESFLHTPHSKSTRFLQKDKEITKLRYEIDIERFEKSDLAEELGLQNERNKKLNQQMADKTAEIVKLRDEIMDLENNVLQRHHDYESQELQRCLRGEIHSLEKYVAQLEIEQNQLRTERDSLRDNLKKIEGECIIWQDKVMTTSKSNEKLLESQEHLELELGHLRSHCMELSALLEETRKVKFNESLPEVDSSVTEIGFGNIDCKEDLACAVVEVQLRDSQKENNDLKSLLKGSRENATKFSEDLIVANSKLVELEKDYGILKADNDDLLEKMLILTETQASLKSTRLELAESSHKISTLIDDNSSLNLNISELEKQIHDKATVIDTLENTNKTLNEHLYIAQDSYSHLEKTLTRNNELYDRLQEKNGTLQSEYYKLLENYNNTDFQLQTVVKQFDQLNTAMQCSLKKFGTFVCGNSNLNVEDTALAFETIFVRLQEKSLQQLTEKDELITNLNDFEKLTLKLKGDLAQLNEKEVINLEERHTLTKNLNYAEEQRVTLEEIIEEQETKIRTLNFTIDEMAATITDLEILKEAVVQEKEIVITDLQTTNSSLDIKLTKSNEELLQSRALQTDLRKSLENLQQIKGDFEIKIMHTQLELKEHKENKVKLSKTIAELNALTSVFEQQISETTEELTKCRENEQNLQQTLDNLENLKSSLEHQLHQANDKISQQRSTETSLEEHIFEQEKQYQEDIKMLNLEIANYNMKIQEHEIELQTCQSNYAAAQKDLALISRSKGELQDEIKSCKNAFEKRITLLDSTICKVEHDLQVIIEEKYDLQENFDRKCVEFQKLQIEREEDMLKLTILEEDLNEAMIKLKVTESECTDKDDLLSKANQELLIMKLAVEQKNENLRILEGDIEKRELQKTKLNENISKIELVNKELRFAITELQGECSILQNLKLTLEGKCDKLESNVGKIISELSIKNEQLDILMKRYNHYEEDTKNKVLKLTNALATSNEEFERLINSKNVELAENTIQIHYLQDALIHMKEANESLSDQESKYLKEIYSMKEELNVTLTKYTEALQLRQEIEHDNEIQMNNLTENLHELIEKYNHLDKTHIETLLQLKNAHSRIGALENYKFELDAKLGEQKVKYESKYNTWCDKLNFEICNLVTKENELKSQLLNMTEQLNTCSKSNDELNCNFHKVCDELAQMKLQKSELRRKLNEFTNTHRDLKHAYGSLKTTHLQFIHENCQSLEKLQMELSEQITFLVEENSKLQDTVTRQKENIILLQNEQNIIDSLYNEKIDQKDTIIKELENDNGVCRQHISKLTDEEKVIRQQISMEQDKLREYKKEYNEAICENKLKIEEFETNIMKLKSANNILETGKEILQKELYKIKGDIEELEKSKLDDEKRFTGELNSRDETIQNLNNNIMILKIQVSENMNKNNELLLELCTINESLELLTKQHGKLEQMIEDEKQHYTDELLAVPLESNTQNFVENLQSHSKCLSQEICSTKKHIGDLKMKLKKHFAERQALKLKINSTCTKLQEQDLIVMQEKATLDETNRKLLAKIDEVLELENEKSVLQQRLANLSAELDTVKTNSNSFLESQAKVMKETENNLIRAHENAIEVKNDLLNRINLVQNENINEKQLRNDLEKLLEGEKIAKEILEIRVLELTNEKSRFNQKLSILKHSIQSLGYALADKPIAIIADSERNELYVGDIDYLNDNIDAVKVKILEVLEQNSVCSKQMLILHNEKEQISHRLEEMIVEKDSATEAKEKLINDYTMLCNEKMQREHELKHLADIQIAHSVLKAKYEQLMEYNGRNDAINEINNELQEKITLLEKKTADAYTTYKKFAGYSTTHKAVIEKLITERNVLENTLYNVKRILLVVQTKTMHILDDREHSRLLEQLQSFEVIAEDIQKQFLRISRKIHEIISMAIQVPANIYDLLSAKTVTAVEDIFGKIDFDEELERIVDCRDMTTALLEQLSAFEVTVNAKTKCKKENVLQSSNTINVGVKVKDEDLKKKNLMLKQRLTLAENAKSNLEKKIKQLRQENKMIGSRSEEIVTLDSNSYKNLVHQHKESKAQYEKTLGECKVQYDKLLREHEDCKTKNNFSPEHDVKLEMEVVKLREAYGNVISDNSKLDLENLTIRKLLDDRTAQLGEFKLIQEAYEKLLEENNTLRMEFDTVKYKRNRDREVLHEALQKDPNENKKIQAIRNEYEGKLEKMKNKMVELYREEIDKEVQKHKRVQIENVQLYKTIERLQIKSKDSSPRSDNGICEYCPSDSTSEKSSTSRKDDRKMATLPRTFGMSVIEEDAVLKRNTLTSVPPGIGQKMEMEDEEEDMFNNKYLSDLKEGRCTLPSGRESNAGRLSELKWRNSMCPPHLKSSYPAETQFNSPRQFKEDDLKVGVVDFDDSMSTRLIPGEKPRRKDIGTTSYKKPGPPTPSKNGGRVSLQGNELHSRDVLREQNGDTKTPKRITPNRLKALFMGRNSSVKDNSENQPGTPRSKRLSIFRKPK